MGRWPIAYGPWYGLWPYWLMAHMPIPRSYGPCLWHDGLWPTIGHTTCGPLHGLCTTYIAYSPHLRCDVPIHGLQPCYGPYLRYANGNMPYGHKPLGFGLHAHGPSVHSHVCVPQTLHRPLDYSHCV